VVRGDPKRLISSDALFIEIVITYTDIYDSSDLRLLIQNKAVSHADMLTTSQHDF